MRVTNADPITRRDPALRAIVFYKLGRGALAVLSGLVLAGLVLHGGDRTLQHIARLLREHWTTGVSGHISAILLRALDVRHAWFAVLGLELDGAVTLLEGFALHHGHRWGYWLVVGVAALFVPFELISLAHKPTLGRALPKGSILPVPFFCEVRLGPPLYPKGSRQEILGELERAVAKLANA